MRRQGIKCNPFLKFYAMFSKYFVGKIYKSLIRKVFTIPRAFATPDVQAATNVKRLMLSCCSELIAKSLMNNKPDEPIHGDRTLIHGGQTK